MSIGSTISFYATYLATRLSAGKFIRKGKISLLGLKPVYGKYFTQEYVTKVWNVFYIPTFYQYNLTELIRSEMFKQFPKVKLVIYSYAKPSSFSQNNRSFTMEVERAMEAASALRSAFDQLDEKDRLMGKKLKGPDGRTLMLNKATVEKEEENAARLSGIKQALDEGHCGFDVTYFVQASAQTIEELDSFERCLMGLLGSVDTSVGITPVDRGIFTYLQSYSPGSYLSADYNKRFPTMFLTDENLTAFLPYDSTGLVNKVGLPIGLDADSKLPSAIDFFNTMSGKMMLITGATGSGKTCFSYQLMLLLLHYNWHGFVVDVKGGEWREILAYIKQYTEFVLSDYNGFFVNMLRLDDVPCTKETCGELYDNALQGVVSVFVIKTALLESEGNLEDLKTILKKAVIQVFKDVKRDDPSTFKQTKNFTYQMVLDNVRELSNSKTYSEKQKQLCRLVLQRCGEYFGQSAVNSAMKHEITLGDVLNSPLTIFSLEKNTTASTSSTENIFLHMMHFLIIKKQTYRKQQGLFTCTFYEEVQQCTDNGMLVSQINEGVTSARSFNAMVGVITNSVKSIDTPVFAPMVSNFSIKIIGRVESGDEKILCSNFGCAIAAEEIKRLQEKPVEFLHNFVCVYNTGNGAGHFTFKTCMPAEMIDRLDRLKRQNQNQQSKGKEKKKKKEAGDKLTWD